MSRSRRNKSNESPLMSLGSDFDSDDEKPKKKVKKSKMDDEDFSDEEPKKKKSLKRGDTPKKSKDSRSQEKSKTKSKTAVKSSAKKSVDKAPAKPKKKAKDDDDEDDVKANFMVGQKYETPPEDDSLYAFYTSLLEQRPESLMAKKWCLEYGALDMDTAQKIYDELEKEKRKKK